MFAKNIGLFCTNNCDSQKSDELDNYIIQKKSASF